MYGTTSMYSLSPVANAVAAPATALKVAATSVVVSAMLAEVVSKMFVYTPPEERTNARMVKDAVHGALAATTRAACQLPAAIV